MKSLTKVGWCMAYDTANGVLNINSGAGVAPHSLILDFNHHRVSSWPADFVDVLVAFMGTKMRLDIVPLTMRQIVRESGSNTLFD